LAAELTVERATEAGRHIEFDPATYEAELALSLHLVADPHTQSAPYTNVHVEADEVRIVLHIVTTSLPRKRKVSNLILVHQLLEPAVPCRVTRRTLQWMASEEQH
jgi:hypothetical protein